MGIFASTPVSMIPSDSQSAGSVKGHSAKITSNLRTMDDPKTLSKMMEASGAAFLSVQQQIDKIYEILRAPIPQPEAVTVSDPNGNLIAWIGFSVVNNVTFQGAWFRQLYVGGSDAAHAVISTDAAGDVTINGANFTLTTGGVTISITDQVIPGIAVPGVDVKDDVNLWHAAHVAFGYFVFDPANVAVVSLLLNQAGGNSGLLVLNDPAMTQNITLDGQTGGITASGDINTNGIYRVGGVAGVTTSLTAGIGLTVVTGSAVTGTPGVGQSTGTFVKSVSLNTGSTLNFVGGILT